MNRAGLFAHHPEGRDIQGCAAVPGALAPREDAGSGALACREDAGSGAPACGEDAGSGAPACGEDAGSGAPACREDAGNGAPACREDAGSEALACREDAGSEGFPALGGARSGIHARESLRRLGIRVIRRLSGGGGWNEIWLAARGPERLVVRLDTLSVRALGLDRAAEFQVLHSIQGQGLGPELVVSDPGRGVLVTRWLPGRACTPVMLRNPRLLRALGALLRRLHETVAPPPDQPALDLGGAMARYAEMVGSAQARRLARAGTRAWRAARCQQRPAALCHNDAVAANIVTGAELRLIDWEFAGPGDPLFDLAVVISHHGLTEAQARILLAAARGGARLPEWRALRRLTAAYGHLRELWEAAARRLRQQRPSGGFARLARILYARQP